MEELQTYQLLDVEHEQMGLVQTDAPEEIVQDLWEKVYYDDADSDEAEAEQLSVLLECKGYKVNRIWAIEIIP